MHKGCKGFITPLLSLHATRGGRGKRKETRKGEGICMDCAFLGCVNFFAIIEIRDRFFVFLLL